jgi:class I fructose-bisphosphate aldolase
MRPTVKVKNILKQYDSDNPGTKANLTRMLMYGKLGGSGKLMILPVDQGFEHGPVPSFSMNPDAYDPYYHYRLAIDAGVSAYAAPLGMLETGGNKFAGTVPTILKLNSSNSLKTKDHIPSQALTAPVSEALRLGCSGVGFTIYPGSSNFEFMIEELAEITAEAKACGLVVVVWSYPRGETISKLGENAVDVIAYGAHMACLAGAHIIKVKLPTDHIEFESNKKLYKDNEIDISSLASRVAHIKECCFAGRRLVVFSGGAAKDENELYKEIEAIRDGGGDGSIIGRNSFQRRSEEAIILLDNLMNLYL